MYESIVIENTCLLSDFLLNFNKIIYEIFQKLKFNALEKFKWGLLFTQQFSQHLDVITDKEIKYLLENFEAIEHQEPLENPFENNLKRFEKPSETTPTAKPKKKKKTFKKGPQLTSFGEL